MEEFNIDLQLDEAAEARIAHADFLNRIKDWAIEMAGLIEPYEQIVNVILDDDRSEEEMMVVQRMFPLGLTLTINQMNELYAMMQKEAVAQLGAPFQLHGAHHPQCGISSEKCGHQDHYLPKEDE
jgi:hypothetical protein